MSAPRDPTDVWPNPGELRANYEYKHYKLLLQPGVAPANEERKPLAAPILTIPVALFNTLYGVTAADLPSQGRGEGRNGLRQQRSQPRPSPTPQPIPALASSKHVFGESPPLTRRT